MTRQSERVADVREPAEGERAVYLEEAEEAPLALQRALRRRSVGEGTELLAACRAHRRHGELRERGEDPRKSEDVEIVRPHETDVLEGSGLWQIIGSRATIPAVKVGGAVALVTGASSGIGAALCRALVEANASVALVARPSHRLDALAASLPSGRVAALPCDVRDPDAVAATVAAARARLGPIDLLVNNAGIGRYRSFLETGPDETAAILDTNLHGALHFLRAVLPDMLARRRGWIVNVASIAARIGSRNHAIYCASKFALAGVSESLGYELEGSGVGITLVNPGVIDTPFFDHASFAAFPSHARARAIPAARVAAAIMRAVEREDHEITVPRSYALGTVLKTVAPGFFRRLMRRNA